MIIRNFGVRHGRRVLASPLLRSCVRTHPFSTEPMAPDSTKTTLAKHPAVDDAGAAADSTQIPFSYPNQKRDAERVRKEQIEQIPRNFRELTRQKRETTTIGAEVEPPYRLEDAIKNPPSDVTLEMLMAAQCHMGHNTARWNPANSRYIHGERDGIHIISLETTAVHLRRAARVVEEVAYAGGLILFVGNRPGQMSIVVRMAELAGACHLFQKWTPGTITNRDTLLASGLLQIVDERDMPIAGFEKHLMDRRPVMPDLVVCLNPLENYTLLQECATSNIPTIGVIDTNADPTWVTYQIPANDDSLRSIALIAGVLGKAGRRGQERRLQAAKDGVVTWQNPQDVEAFIKKDVKEKVVELNKGLLNNRQQQGENPIMEGALEQVKKALEEDSL